jgi:Uma2 family endonuclease
MTWEEACADPVLQDLPYKIELNRWGNIEMSPAKSYHAEFQAWIAHLLRTLKPDGISMTECPIDTAENTKAADVAWVSYARRRVTPRDVAYTVAPEICVEILSPSNWLEEQMHKGELYMQVGAEEFWLCDEKGGMRFFDASGQLERSRLCPEFPARVEIPD